MTINVSGPGSRGSISLDSSSTTVRQSPRTDFGTQVRNGIAAGAGTAGEALGVAAPFVPGAAVVSAAVSGAAGGISGGSASGSGAGGGLASAGGSLSAGGTNVPLSGPGLNTPTGSGGAQQGGGSQQDLIN